METAELDSVMSITHLHNILTQHNTLTQYGAKLSNIPTCSAGLSLASTRRYSPPPKEREPAHGGQQEADIMQAGGNLSQKTESDSAVSWRAKNVNRNS